MKNCIPDTIEAMNMRGHPVTPAGAGGDATQEDSLPAPRKMTTLKAAFNILGNAGFFLLLAVMVFLVYTMVQSRLSGGPPAVAGHQIYIVYGGSMSPAFEAGSLAFVKPVDPQSVGVGDIITFRPASGGSTLTTHRIMAVNSQGSEISFTTRGDANQVDDPAPVYADQVVGRVAFTVPYAGYLMDFGQSRAGIIVLIFIPGALIIAFELRHLFRLAEAWEAEKQRKKNEAGKSLPEEA